MLVEARRVTKSFGARTALAGVDLSLDEGEFATLVGPNGAGKTTLLRILATLSHPTTGSVHIAGLDAGRAGEVARRSIGFLSHRTMLYDGLTAEQNLRFYARMYDVEKEARRIDELLERVGLDTRRHDRVQTFSRGMKQRLSVARAVLHQPRVLLLDEPYTGLDPQAVETLTDLLLELAGEGRAILLTTHRIGRGLAAAGRILVLHQGRVVYDQVRTSVSLDTFADTYRAITAQ